MNRFVTVLPQTGGLGQWIGPSVFSALVHVTMGAAYFVWCHMVTPPRAPSLFMVELVAVQDVAGTVDARKTTQNTSVARALSELLPSSPEPKNQHKTPAVHEPVEAVNSTQEIDESEKMVVPEIPHQLDIKRAVDAATTEYVNAPEVKLTKSRQKLIITSSLIKKPKPAAKTRPLRPARIVPRPKRNPHRAVRRISAAVQNKFPARTAKKYNTETLGQENTPQVEQKARRRITKLTETGNHAAAPTASAGEATAKLVLPRYAVPGRGNPLPVYPRMARRHSLEGRLLLRAEIDRKGNVKAVKIAKSSGHAILDQAAETAVRRWKFEPGRRFGIPVRAAVDIPVVFRLRP